MSPTSNDDQVFDEKQHATLRDVLDAIIPADQVRGMPGAGELGLAGHIAALAAGNDELKLVIQHGLGELDALLGDRRLSNVPVERRNETLERLDAASPAFVPSLLFHTYTAYYQHSAVVEALGLEARPPHPDGYAMDPTDFSILDAVRKRGRLYR